MCSEGTPLSHLIERSAVQGRAIVAEVGDGEGRRVLDAPVGAEASVGRERIVGAVDRRSECDRGQLLIPAQRFERRLVANAEVDAEVHVASVDLTDLEPVIDAGGRALGQLARESETRAVPAIDVDTGCTPAMREEADAEAIVRRAEPGLGEIDAGVVGRHVVTGQRAGLRHRRILEDPASAQ